MDAASVLSRLQPVVTYHSQRFRAAGRAVRRS